MKLSILNWEAKGLRCPDHSIVIKKEGAENEAAISLVQMPNGTGKTTTLELLRAALSGKYSNPEDMRRMDVMDLRKRGDNSDEGFFTVAILCDNKKITIELRFDFVDGKVYQSTTTSAGGKKEGYNLPREYQKFLRPEFINYLVFDGELAQQFLDKDFTNAKYLIEHLFQIDLFVSMQQKLHEYWQFKSDNKASSGAGVTARKRQVTQLRDLLRKREKDQAALIERMQESDKRIKSLKEKNEKKIKSLDEFRDRIEKAEKAFNLAETHKKQQLGITLLAFRNPSAVCEAFAKDLEGLNASLERLKLPESTAKEFFHELAEEEECLCGRPINETEREHILKHADDYLGDDYQSVLNVIKQAISTHVVSESLLSNRELDKKIENLKSSIKKENEAKTTLISLEEQAGKNDPEIYKIQEEIKKQEEVFFQSKIELHEFEEVVEFKDVTAIKNIAILRKKLTEAEDAYAEITNTATLKSKKEIIDNVLSKSHELSLKLVNEDVCELSNSRIVELMPHNDIEIERIDQCLVLKDRSGGSAGETLTVAYAFLSSLFNKTELSLPFIVDSPAGPLDIQVRKEIAKVIPKLSAQFIAFTISSENSGFLGPLQEAANDSINYFTVFRKGRKDLEDLAKKHNIIQDTDDGIVVSGKEFFENFQVEKE